MITKRTLEKWRRESLHHYELDDKIGDGTNVIDAHRQRLLTLDERVLRLTQELLDQHLLRK